MTFRLPRIQQGQPIVDSGGRPTPYFVRQLNDAFGSIEDALTQIIDVVGIQDQFQTDLTAAQMATADAQAAALAAQQATAAAAKEQALVNSYIAPNSVLSTTATTITVAAHTRYYADGTSVGVSGGTVPTTGGGGAVDYVSYSDPMRVGGAVTYVASTSQPTQGGNVHVVGAVTVPTTGTATGGAGPQRPGYVEP